MERGSSTYSLPSRGGSELGSNYMVETGIYISSIAATIVVAALITIGVLFITMVITLTVMLQSCQNQNTGVLELQKARIEHASCRVLSLQSELDRLEPEFPAICKTGAIQYMELEQYLKDFSLAIRAAKKYFRNLKPKDDGLDAILMDIDGGMLSSQPLRQTHLLKQIFHKNDEKEEAEEGLHPVNVHLLDLYSMLQSSGWSLILISRMPERQRNATIESLISAGYRGWSIIYMRSESEMQMEDWEYFSTKQAALQRVGFRVMSVISRELDALRGSSSGNHVFKLPNSRYYKLINDLRVLNERPSGDATFSFSD
ncbi:hypothetical protein Scep_005556 [Stephania cephalantha]|uniref:Acid phosphatase n=1 Tax=Stephania cephalantha TaxID=152367 RepID=A0AAP0KUK4_9MAGN